MPCSVCLDPPSPSPTSFCYANTAKRQEKLTHFFFLSSLDYPRGNETIDWLNVSTVIWRPASPCIHLSSVGVGGCFSIVHRESDVAGTLATYADGNKPELTKTSASFLCSLNADRISNDKNSEMTKWVDRYLGVGEWVMDQSTAVAGSSGWFNRTR